MDVPDLLRGSTAGGVSGGSTSGFAREMARPGGGCSGLSYFMDLVDGTEPKDKLFEFGGHQVAIDRKSYLFINGSEIDFQQTMVKTGFVFNNPLASRSCSCGESFTL